jgi:N-acetylneuraminic acid mutarotase
MRDARAGQTATLLASGKVLVAGGDPNDPSAPDEEGGDSPFSAPAIASAELYDPPTGKWSRTGSMVAARMGQTATLLSDGEVLVAGGQDSESGSMEGGNRLSSAELYDPASGRWSATGSMTTTRSGATATLLSTGKVLVAGGGSASAELYDPVTGTWSATGSMPAAHTGATATLLANGKVLVAGGFNNNLVLTAYSSAELYDPTTGNWSPTGSMTRARVSQTATLLANGKVLVAGGSSNGTDDLSSAEVYDPTTGTWTRTSSMAVTRANFTATLLPTGAVLVVGGGEYELYARSGAELYEPSTAKWTAAGSMSIQRLNQTATLLPSGKVLVAGGNTFIPSPQVTGEPAVASAELWSPQSARSALVLRSGTLRVVRGRLRVRFNCRGGKACRGTFSIAHRGIACMKGSPTSFSIPAGKTTTLHVPLSNRCLAKLRAARGHHIQAKLTARPTSGQPRLTKTISLLLR